MSERVVIDDRDVRIRYRGVWYPSGSSAGTQHIAGEAGATISFAYHGTDIYVYGVIPPGEGQVVRADFQLDNGVVSSMTRNSSKESEYTFNELWYQTTGISSTNHTLLITYRGSTSVGDRSNSFYFDRVEYEETPYTPPTIPSDPNADPTPPQPPGLTPSPSPSPSAGLGQSVSSGETTSTSRDGPLLSGGDSIYTSLGTGPSNATIFNQPESSGSPNGGVGAKDSGSGLSSTSGSSSSPPLGAILGGIMGGVAALLLLAIFLLFLKRRRQRSQGREMEENIIPDPFSFGSSAAGSSENSTFTPLSKQPHPSDSLGEATSNGTTTTNSPSSVATPLFPITPVIIVPPPAYSTIGISALANEPQPPPPTSDTKHTSPESP